MWTFGEAIAAKRAALAGLASKPVFFIKGVVAAAWRTGPTVSASVFDAEAKYGDFTQESGQKAHGAPEGAVDHDAHFS